MAIDPALVTTVQVNDLPYSQIERQSIIPHEIRGVLSKAQISEIIDFVKTEVNSSLYEIKFINAPNQAYINEYFEQNDLIKKGLGLAGKMWDGWAICNGNNGTDNLDGRTLIGYGQNNPTLGEKLGTREVTLTTGQIPTGLKGTYNFFGSSADNGDPGAYIITTPSQRYTPEKIIDIPLNGGGQPHNNMQPSMVILVIQKIR